MAACSCRNGSLNHSSLCNNIKLPRIIQYLYCENFQCNLRSSIALCLHKAHIALNENILKVKKGLFGEKKNKIGQIYTVDI